MRKYIFRNKTRQRNSNRSNTKKRRHIVKYGGNKKTFDINKSHIEVYYGITFHMQSQVALNQKEADEIKAIQNKYKMFIEELMHASNYIVKIGEEPFISRLQALDEYICEKTNPGGYQAKKEISTIIQSMGNIYSYSNNICFLLCNDNDNIIGICNINLPLFEDDVKKNIIYIEYLCGSNYKYSGTILLNVVKQLLYISGFDKIELISYESSVGFYLKNGFTKTMSSVNTPLMTFTR